MRKCVSARIAWGVPRVSFAEDDQADGRCRVFAQMLTFTTDLQMYFSGRCVQFHVTTLAFREVSTVVWLSTPTTLRKHRQHVTKYAKLGTTTPLQCSITRLKRLLFHNIRTETQYYVCRFVWVWNLVSYTQKAHRPGLANLFESVSPNCL